MNSAKSGVYRVGVYETDVEITYNNQEAYALLNFLFGDMSSSGAPAAARAFDVVMAGKPTRMSLWEQEKQIYFGQCKQTLAHLLVNEVIYEGIIGNHHHLALHAGAVAAGKKGILLPGKSGSGKSSLTAWLVGEGFGYLTDELVLLATDGPILPFTRPLSLKAPASDLLAYLFKVEREKLLTGPQGTMIPYRELNATSIKAFPTLHTIIFPEFVADRDGALTKISHARCCLKLLETYVNARNLAGHGFSEMAALTRGTEAYELRYGSFDDLHRLLDPLLLPLCAEPG
jgi:hypothetical protein